MGSHAILDSFDGHVLAAAAPELEAKYYIPIFWLALFEPGDLGREPIAKAQYGWQQEPFAIAAPYLRATSEAACACFARRSRALERLCTPAHAPLVATFAKFIATVKPTILVRLDSLAAMTLPGVYAESVARALALVTQLDDANADPDRYLVDPLTKVWAGRDWAESKYAAAVLSGWNWHD